jgi:predicted CoA-substrate-specific enzyme activase
MDGDEVLSSAVVPATTNPERTGLLALEEALGKAGLHSLDELRCIVGTGYGRIGVSFIRENVSEITCHARGAHWLHPKTRTVIDVGGQDCKVISVDDEGKVLDFLMNDKCAAGTGKFFEAMARTLHCGLEEFSELSLQSDSPASITKQCSVFAESEVVTLINSGVNAPHIAAGLTDSIARRLLAMVFRVGVVPEVVLTGGGARNEALVRGLEEKLGEKIARLSQNPQTVGALGAALFARERLLKVHSGR